MASGRLLLTTTEAAKLLGVGTSSVKRWADEGRLPVVRTPGGHRRFRPEDVAALVGAEAGDEPQRLVETLPALTREEIDELPVGVIRLDDEGTVELYSAREAAFSGLAVDEVEGRNFFLEIAPCTNNGIFLGRFRRGIATDHLDLTIDYTFTYRMRPTPVRVHLYRDRASATNWVVVDFRDSVLIRRGL